MAYEIDEQSRELARTVGYEVSEDPDQPGMFVWRNGNEGCDQSFPNEGRAWDDAAFNATSEVMGHHNMDSEEWDMGSHAGHMDLAHEMMGTSPKPR